MIMKTFSKDRTDVARFVDDMLYNLNKDCAWTMTITAGKSEDYFALIAIEGLSEDTAKALGWTFLDEPFNILTGNTQDGQSLLNLNERRSEMSEAKYGIEPKGWYNEEDLRAVRNYGLWEGMGYASAAWVVVIASFLYVIGVFG